MPPGSGPTRSTGSSRSAEPVRFADAVAALDAQGVTRVLEVGPDARAHRAGRRTPTPAALAVPALRRDRDEVATLLDRGRRAVRRPAPTSTGRRVRRRPAPARPAHLPVPAPALWLARDPVATGRRGRPRPRRRPATRCSAPRSTLAGRRRAASSPAALGRPPSPGWPTTPCSAAPCCPGTALVELALAAGERAGAPALDELLLQAPLALPEPRRRSRCGSPSARPTRNGRRPVTIHSRADDGEPWTLHATGVLSAPTPRPPAPTWSLAAVRRRADLPLDGLYDALADAGLRYGPAFQGLRAVWRRGEEVFAEVRPGRLPADGFGVHPALLDAVLHAIGAGGLLPATACGCRSRSAACTVHAAGAGRCGSGSGPERGRHGPARRWPTRPGCRSPSRRLALPAGHRRPAGAGGRGGPPALRRRVDAAGGRRPRCPGSR